MRAGVVVAVLLLLGAGWWVVRHGEVPTVDPPETSAALDTALVQDLPAPAESAARLPQRMAGSAQPVLPVPSVEVAPTSLAATTESRVEIVGAVLDAAGAPIAGADVWYLPSGRVLQAAGFVVPIAIPFIGLGRQGPALLMDVPLAVLAHTATDAEGRFAIAGSGESGSSSRDPYPAPGQPQLLVRAPGYAIGSRRAGDGLEPVELRLRQAALITGRVVDERDQPLPGVSVRVLDDFGFDPDHRELTQDPAVLLGELHSVISGPDGAFRLDGLWQGEATLACVQAGRVTSFVDRVRVTEGQTTDVGVVAVVPGAIVEGRALDAAGHGVAGATVFTTASEVSVTGRGCMISTLGPEDDGLPFELEAETHRGSCRAVTAADGRFRIEDVGVPTVTLYARALGYEAAKLRDVSTGRSDAVLTLRAETVLLARVVEQGTGRPLPEATLDARRIVGPQHDSAPLRIERSADGYLVRGTGRLGTELTARAPGFAETTLRTPGPGLTGRQDVVVELPRGAGLRGSVRTADGQPIASASIELATPGKLYSPAIASTRSDSAGAFALTDAPAGDWELRVRAEGHPTPSPRPVTTQVGESLDGLDFVLEESATLEVVVHDLGAGVEAPRHGASLQREDATAERRPQMAQSREDGRAVFVDLAPGSYLLEIKGVATRHVSLAAGEHQVLRLGLTPPHLELHVLERGRPVAGMTVEARRVGAEYSDNRRSPPSDADGRIVFDLAVPGRFELLAYGADELPGLDLVGQSEPFSIEWGGRLALDVPLGTGRLAGRAMSKLGPVAGEEFFVERTEGGSGVVRSDDEGDFTLDRLLPGTYGIVTSQCEHGCHLRLSEGPFTLTAGQSVDDVLLLVRFGAALCGSVRTASGAAAPESSVVLVTGSSPDDDTRHAAVSKGRYRLDGLPAGSYRVCAHRSDEWGPQHECPGARSIDVPSESALVLDLVIPNDG
jgi:protocatechuate 3,4-dioxygenase beta subunit